MSFSAAEVAAPGFLYGGGEMGVRMRAFDWSTSPLGPPEMWQQSLRSFVSLMLNAQQPMFVVWGPELVFLYNDAYAPIFGKRHPEALGRPFKDVWWDIWEQISPLVRRTLDGEASFHRDLLIPMERHGDREDAWFSFSYTPIADDMGVVTGMFCAASETSGQVRSERRREALFRLDDRLRDQSNAGELSFAASELLGEAIGASRVGYGTFDPASGTLSVERDWTAPGFDSVAGVHRFSDYGAYVDSLRHGEPVANGDVEADPRTAANLEAMRSIRVRAFLDMPVVEFGKTVAQLFVHSATPRSWTEEEIAFVRDFAERTRAAIARRMAEQELRESEARLRELNETLESQVAERTAERDGMWEASPDLMLVIDFDGVLRRVNPAWTTILGYGPDELVGHHVNEFVLVDDRASATEAYISALRGAKPTIENRYRHKDGSIRWISWTAAPAKGMTYATGRDVTAERDRAAKLQAAEAARRQADEMYRAYFENTAEALFVVGVLSDGGFTIDDLNPAHQAGVGFRLAEVAGRRIDEILPTDVAQKVSSYYRAVLTSGELLQYRETFEFQGETKHWDTVLVPVRDSAGQITRLIGSSRDLTPQMAAEEALRQSQKMEAVGQLTGGLAHDFNNLLAGISGSLELISARIAQGRMTDVDRYLVAAQGAAKRAAALTHRLLAFSRRQTLDPKPTDVNRLVAGMEELVRRTVGPEIDVEAIAEASLWSVLVDPNQLENALLNLCINARDAMPDGGKITIKTANRWLDERAGRERDLAPGQYVSLCVSDNGTGMAPDVIKRAFDPFFTTKPIGLGTGLGLSMIYGFARQSGGQVRIYSEVGQGTTVCIYLPRHHVTQAEVEMPATGANFERAQAGETVLVIDDEPLVRMLVVDVLEELGYTALEAGDGPEGLKILRSDVRLDLLITDVGLPNGMNGRQVAEAARELRPDLKVLFVTGYAENAVLSHGHLDAGMQVVTKPFDMAMLASRIKDMIPTG